MPSIKIRVDGVWTPIYTILDASDTVEGNVKLSDSVNSTLNAASGKTAATPIAVKSAYDLANAAVSKTTTSAQSIDSAVTINGGLTVPSTKTITGSLTGNASTATKLASSKTISLSGGVTGTATSFDGSANISIPVTGINASNINSGTLSLDRLPEGVSNRVVTVTNQTARFALTAANVSKGDIVYQSDTKIMYIVTDTANLTSESGYQAYSAGYAAEALALSSGGADRTKLDGIAINANNYSHPTATAYTSGLYKITTNNLGHVTAATAVTKSDITGLGIPAQDTNTTYSNATTSTSGLMSTGDKSKLDGIAAGAQVNPTIDSALSSTSTNPIQNKVVQTALAGKSDTSHTHSYAGSASVGGPATTAISADSAAKLITSRTIALSGIISGSTTFDGSANSTITTSMNSGVIGTTYLTDLGVTTAKLAAGAVTNAKLGDASVGTSKLADSSVTSAKIVDGTIVAADMATTAGVIYVGATEPTATSVRLWVQTVS